MLFDNSNKKCPCMKCTDRKESCHVSCSPYKEWQSNKRKENKMISINRNNASIFSYRDSIRNKLK